jgi:hypothetical protein
MHLNIGCLLVFAARAASGELKGRSKASLYLRENTANLDTMEVLDLEPLK